MSDYIIEKETKRNELSAKMDDELIEKAKKNAIKTKTDTNKEIHISRAYTTFVPVSDDKPLSLAASRIFTFAMMQINKDDEEFKCFVVTKKELAEALNMKLSNVYNLFDEGLDCYIIKELKKSSMKLMDETRYQADFPIFDICIYDKQTGEFAFRFSPMMKPILIGLGTYNPYFSSIAKQSILLNSTDAIELHRMIENQYSYIEYQTGQYGKRIKVELSIDYIRKRTFTTNSYKTTNHFKSTFIKRLVDDINKNTNLFIHEYQNDKNGKKAKSIVFDIQRKLEVSIDVNEESCIENSKAKDELIIDFKDKELNEIFNDYIELLELDKENRKDQLKIKGYIRNLNEYAKSEDGTLNVKKAKEILNYSLIKEYTVLYPEPYKKNNKDDVKKADSSKLKKLEEDALDF